MQPDKKQIQTSNNYFYRALVYGAKPFLYRGRVRSLLGFPEWTGGNATYPPLLLPVGFRYANANQTSMAYSLDYKNSPGNTDSLSLQAEQRQELENIGDYKAREEHSIDIPAISDRNISYPFLEGETKNNTIGLRTEKPAFREKSQGMEQVKESMPETETFLHHRKAKPVVHEVGTGKDKINPGTVDRNHQSLSLDQSSLSVFGSKKSQEPKGINIRKDNSGLTTEMKAFPGEDAREEQIIDIPGISDRNIFYPFLDGERKNNTIGLRTEKPALREKSQGMEQVKESVPETETLLHHRKAKPVVHEVGTGKDKINPGIVKEGAATTQLSDHREEPVNGGDVKIINDKTKVKANPDYEFGSQTYWDSVARVEQLRQQVHRLNTSKVLKTEILSSSSGEKVKATRGIKKEEQLQVPSHVPPVAIVKPLSRQHRTSRVPCAFWERSYLGRFHLRTLR